METRAERVGDILGRLFESMSWGRRVFEGRALTLWSDVVGKAVGQHSRPLRIENGKIVVEVKDAIWKQEILLLSPEIIQKMNERLGEEVVKDIVLVVH